LDPGSEVLVPTLMAVTATVWAVGFAAYTFIYQYFAAEHLHPAKQMAHDVWLGIPVPEEHVQEMQDGLTRNFRVFSGFVIAGALSFLTIAFGLSALVLGNEAYVLIIEWFFAAALLSHVVLFTYELGTSMRQVWGLRRTIRQARGR
jgi:hypothetical protein